VFEQKLSPGRHQPMRKIPHAAGDRGVVRRQRRLSARSVYGGGEGEATALGASHQSPGGRRHAPTRVSEKKSQKSSGWDVCWWRGPLAGRATAGWLHGRRTAGGRPSYATLALVGRVPGRHRRRRPAVPTEQQDGCHRCHLHRNSRAQHLMAGAAGEEAGQPDQHGSAIVLH
jgi:hypothetical protein